MEFATVLDHLQQHFGVVGDLSALGSCEDLNFKLKSQPGANLSIPVGKYVVKYIRTGDDQTVEDHIKVQHQVMRHLAAANVPYRCPLPMKCNNSEETTVRIHANDIDYVMHLLTYQDGDLLSNQQYFSPHLLESFGGMIAILSDAMRTSGASTERKTQWDMETAYELIQSYALSVEDPHRRAKMLAMAKEMNDIILSHSTNLRKQLVHADLAPYNVLVHATQRHDGQPILDAIIDFGDVSVSWLVAEIAVALTPLLVPPEADVQRDGFSDDRHPLRTTLLVLRGFLQQTPLNRDEAMALWPLIVLRATLLNLAIAKLLETDPDNEYLKHEIEENVKLVEAVLAVPAASAIAAIVQLCGFTANDQDTIATPPPLTVALASSASSATTMTTTLDLTSLSDAFAHSGEWLTQRDVSVYVKRAGQRAEEGSPVVVVTPVGLPWLIRCQRNVPDVPRSYPTFTALFTAAENVSSLQGFTVASEYRVTVDHDASSTVVAKEALSALYGDDAAVAAAANDNGNGNGNVAVREVVLLSVDRSAAIRVLTVSGSSSASSSSQVGRTLSAGESLATILGSVPTVLVQVLQLRSYAFTTLLDHRDLYQPLHHGRPAAAAAAADDDDGGAQLFPPLFVTHFDWKYLWRPLSVDPAWSSSTVTAATTATTATAATAADAYEALRDTAMYARHEYLGSLQEHYYDVDDLSLLPPLILRGDRAHLIAHTGRPLLDMVNNVAVVGHSHPQVEHAATTQLALLNTNSRFVYPGLGQFAQEIVTTAIPEHARHQLNRVVFVNSGSEATDLALRIARTVVSHRRWKARKEQQQQQQHGGGEDRVAFRWYRDVICMRGGYHGVTTASDEVSTTLNDNPLALETRPEHVHLAPMPNFFRGLYTRDNTILPTATATATATAPAAVQVDPTPEEEELLAAKYAEHVDQMVETLMAQDRAPTAFIAEPLSGNAGGVVLPKSYLRRVYARLRDPSVGALCICDEVQTGYGRLGHGFWGFESPEHEAALLPDIITVAKAAGNGHPLGYVVTSQRILDEFYAAQGSFFSSAGGGPVSCAIGRAVLRTVQEEGLQAHAAEVGALLATGLRALQRKHPHIIGYIHGYGLYQGVEIIAWDQSSPSASVVAPGKRAGTKEARLICRRLLDLGIICHNTGDYSNVLKVKPPLCFSKEDAVYFMAMLDKICTEGW